MLKFFIIVVQRPHVPKTYGNHLCAHVHFETHLDLISFKEDVMNLKMLLIIRIFVNKIEGLDKA